MKKTLLRKLICAGLAMIMAASSALCAAAAVEAPAGRQAYEAAVEGNTSGTGNTTGQTEEFRPEDVSVTWEDSRVFMDLTLGKYQTIRTYGVKGYEDVPFISAADYLALLYEGRERISMENGRMKIGVNGAEAVIDPYADTIRFENPARFRSAGEIDGCIVEAMEFNVITASAKHSSVQAKAEPVTIRLKDYRLPVVAYGDMILMPFLALQNTFGCVLHNTVLAYNGKDYYNVFLADSFIVDEKHADAKDSPYIRAIHSGPFSKKKKVTQAYADYGYYSICLLLDLSFGHKEEKNITTFDEYFTRMNAKASLCSTNPATAMTTEFMLFNYLFDSGHDALFSLETVFGNPAELDLSEARDIADDIMKSEEGRELFEKQQAADDEEKELTANAVIGALLEKGLKVPEIAPLILWGAAMKRNRPENYGDERLDYAGDTAVIYFNAFKDDYRRTPSYYLDPIKEEDREKSTFAFFHECFRDIREHQEVKNVVINISDNGGGSAAALICVLGFFSRDGEVRITNRDMLAGNYREEWYHVDTNLDGVADDNDGFGGLYDFYIMCSGDSYSCGNALPYFAQQDGMAKIIGTAPGGGDCVLASFIDAYGRCAYYSGMLKLGKDDGSGFVSNEKAAKPDLNMMPSVLDVNSVPWFDPEGIADAVRQYKEGKTELTYSDEARAEMISDYLGSLLEKLEKVRYE